MITVLKLNSVVLSLVLCLSAVAQTKKTDRAAEGFEGKVHTVFEEGASLSESPDKPAEGAHYRSESSTYDPNGNQIERINYGGPGGTETIEHAYYSLDAEGKRIEKSYMGGSGIPSGNPPVLTKDDRTADGAYINKRVCKYDP